MHVDRNEYGISLSAGDEGYEALTRWECVKAAFALLWNACLPLPKPSPRPVPVPQPEMTQAILNEALAMLNVRMPILERINADYDRAFSGRLVGDTITIRAPSNLKRELS